jgi:flagellar motor switch protein FliN/FliY
METESTQQAEGSAVQEAAAPATPESAAHPAQFPSLTPSQSGPAQLKIGPLLEVHLKVSVMLGETMMTLGELLKLGPGSVMELNRSAGEPVDVLVNDKMYAKGEVVVVDDVFGVRLLELVEQSREKKA